MIGCGEEDSSLPLTEPPRPLVTPADGLFDVRPVPFESARLVDEATLHVEFLAGENGCGQLSSIDVEHVNGSLVVTVYAGNVEKLAEGEGCTLVGVPASAEVEVDPPVALTTAIYDGTKVSGG